MTIEPKFYMIQMSNNPTSVYYRDWVMKSWRKGGHKIHLYEAVTPETISVQKNRLEFGNKLSKGGVIDLKKLVGVEFTETEKAVWYSHFNLWNVCIQINKPIVIIEHDMKLDNRMGLQTQNFRETNAVGLGRTKSTELKRNVNLPCGCYYVTPYIASILSKRAKKEPIRINVDGHVKKFLDSDKKNWCVDQIIHEKVGTTIVHSKANMV